jgi:hypothetical protein
MPFVSYWLGPRPVRFGALWACFSETIWHPFLEVFWTPFCLHFGYHFGDGLRRSPSTFWHKFFSWIIICGAADLHIATVVCCRLLGVLAFGYGR